VSWRHRIAVVLLTVLAGLPASGAVCTMVCDSAAPKAPSHHHDSGNPSHHDSGKDREEVAAPSTGWQLRSVSEHDCSNHDAVVRRLITTTAQRGDAFAIATPLAAIVQLTFDTSSSTDSALGYSSPPGTAPPTTTALVLRV
jgi:hypothetical protein